MGIALFAFGCSDEDNEKDMEKPVISDNEVPSPTDCQEFLRGETLLVRYTLSDNVELGNFNVEVHNNFDHHSHSTSSSSECHSDLTEEPVNPWVYNQDFSIPEGSKTFTAEFEIDIPADVDPGDYHFMIRVTDKAGWQEFKSVGITLL